MISAAAPKLAPRPAHQKEVMHVAVLMDAVSWCAQCTLSREIGNLVLL